MLIIVLFINAFRLY